MNVNIIGLGKYIPKKVLTNERAIEILRRHGVETTGHGQPLTPKWIEDIVGIRERHLAHPKQNTSDLAKKAALPAIEMAKISPKDLDLIIVGSSSPEKFWPSTACLVQEKLRAKKCEAYDLLAACTSSIYGLVYAQARLLAEKDYRYALVIGAEVLASRLTDWRDINSDLWGDGAGAIVLEKTEENYGILASVLLADGYVSHLTDSVGKGTGYFDQGKTPNIYLDGKPVQRFAIEAMVSLTKQVLQKAEISKEEVSLVIGHQGNRKIIEAAARFLGMPLQKFFINIDKYGNTSAASVPIALTEAYEQNLIRRGDLVLLVGFGGGMTAGAVVFRSSLGGE